MVKLVAMDIDGTLLDSNKNLSEENKKTVKEYEERGIKCPRKCHMLNME